MATYNTTTRSQTLGMASVGLGVLGLVFFWWAPFGMVLALAGLVFGVVGWARASRPGYAPVWAIVGTLFSLAVLVLDIALAWGGLEALQLRAF